MKADSWILHKLPDAILSDWYCLYIYTEHDLQVATYHWLRAHFDRERSDNWIVRSQPTLDAEGGTMKPDLVIYRNTIPYDAIELKCLMDGFRKNRLDPDLDKLQRLKTEHNLRHAYMIVLYDDDDVYSPTRQQWMKNYLTYIGMNVRRHENGRMRRGYKESRARWGRFK